MKLYVCISEFNNKITTIPEYIRSQLRSSCASIHKLSIKVPDYISR